MGPGASPPHVDDLRVDERDAASRSTRVRAPVDQVAIRKQLLKRLMDVVATPASSGGLQDRAIAGDLLLELLQEAEPADREMCARRLREMSQAPKRLLRFLALDAPNVARPILADNKGLDDSELAHIASAGGPAHRAAIAHRREIGPGVATAIAATGDAAAMEALLLNPSARLSELAVDLMVSASREAPRLPPLLIQREEVRPAHALAMFWWCGPAERRHILLRFSAERTQLIENCADLFGRLAGETVVDPALAMALQVIERRQRNRRALQHTRFANLEGAIEEAARHGLTQELSETISLLSGLKTATGARLFSDVGGEGVAVLCKATGLKRQWLRALWTALRRSGPADDDRFRVVSEMYEMLAVAKAQTVLRYWDWRLTAAFTPDAPDEAARSPG